MTEIRDVSPEEHDALGAEMEMALGAVVSTMSGKHKLSGLAVTTLALQVLSVGLEQIGGPASRAYLGCLLDAQSATDARAIRKVNDRARRAMEKMADFYDAKVRELAARKLQ